MLNLNNKLRLKPISLQLIGNSLLEKDFGKKYNKKTLYRMRQFYLLFNVPKVPSLKNRSTNNSYNNGISEQKVPSLVSADQKVASLDKQLSKSIYFKGKNYQKVASLNNSASDFSLIFTKLTWTHFKYLLTIKNDYEREYYTNIAIINHLSVRELINKIKSKEYYRLDENTKNKLIKLEETNVTDFIKNPVLIRNNNRNPDISEKTLQTLILEDLPSFLNELGEGFSFISNEYKIKIDDRYNYIDLLLYNIKYKCYVVIELKVTEFKSEYIGQILKYMNYIDKNLKTIDEDKTIGIIICKKDNQFYLEYCSDERVISREYKLI